jgi:NH3-dependent NAD+ synthetase
MLKDVNRLPQLRDRIHELADKTVKVGILGNADSDMAVIAASNEFGVPGRIPERAFLRITMDRESTMDEVVDFASRVFDLNQDIDKIPDAIGLALVSQVQDTIESNIPPANALATILKKGSAKTLQDTGRLKQSIAHEVV